MSEHLAPRVTSDPRERLEALLSMLTHIAEDLGATDSVRTREMGEHVLSLRSLLQLLPLETSDRFARGLVTLDDAALTFGLLSKLEPPLLLQELTLLERLLDRPDTLTLKLIVNACWRIVAGRSEVAARCLLKMPAA